MSHTTLISGASGGIGGACALALARRGDRIAVHFHRNPDAAESLVSGIRDLGGRAERYRADLTRQEEVRTLCRDIAGELGPIDVLVNNAGTAESAQFQDIEEEDWNRILETNLKSAYLLTRAVLPDMIARKRGCIVNIASVWGQVGASCEVHYSAAKGGLIAMTKALAKEVGPSGIRVNCVAPGVIDTAMIRGLDEATRRALAEEAPLGRLGRPQDVAGAVLFLTGEDASFITGQILGVNGGLVI
ncbi:MAG: 3-oxoacyl-ACP reductase FabG [Eubacteriales bacterium]|nr:3-oxoacyl-ACP reductase FabG [Eubacteriales bacterium]HPF18589.1 3-oxoacyl-ACP reductase FabG [Bacillota bacterium]